MCLSVPGQVMEINNDKAKVSIGGNIYNAGLDLIDDVKVGDYVLLHAGFVIQKIDEKEAEITLSLFKEMNELTMDNK
jgi:hydrogenase expression/formation protein HypC